MRPRLVFGTGVALAVLFYWLSSPSRQTVATVEDIHPAALPPETWALVVGGTSGIGAAIARRLAAKGAHVIIAGRNGTRGRQLVAEMNAFSHGKHTHFERVDASSLRQLSVFHERIAGRFPPIQFLVLSAGILSLQGRVETAEGLDVKMALHVYGRFHLTKLFLPSLEAQAAQGRDVRVLSVLAAAKGSHVADLDDLNLKRSFSVYAASQAAPLYNDLMVESLSLHHPTVSFLHALPGFVASSLGRQMPAYARVPLHAIMRWFGKPASVCGAYMVNALLDPQYKATWALVGEYGERLKPVPDHTPQLRDIVWRHLDQRVAASLSQATGRASD